MDYSNVSTRELNPGQGSIEGKYQSEGNLNDQRSDHNYYPFEMIVITPDVVFEEEQQVGIVEGELQMKNEELEEETFMNNESRDADLSCRFAIEQEHVTEANLEGIEELKSPKEFHSTTKMNQIQNISPDLGRPNSNFNFISENKSIDLNKKKSSLEYIIGKQESSNSYISDNNSQGQSSSSYDTHIQVTKYYSCDLCDCETNNKSSLNKHLRTHTGENPFKCEFCDKSFTQKSKLTTHLRIHTKGNPYICEVCDKSFTEKSTLTTHLRIHTGEKPYSCEVCDRSFSVKSTLTKHLRTHTGEKPYICEHCGKSFTEKGSLVKHLRTHTWETPFICELCNASFSQKSNLIIHLRIHVGDVSHVCKHCNKSFTLKSYLTRHLLTHTGQ